MSSSALHQIGSQRPDPAGVHPLARLGAEEIRQVRAVLSAAGLVAESTRFTYVGLEEPAKGDVLDTGGALVPRRARAILLDVATGVATDTVVSLTKGEVDRQRQLDPLVDGQPAIMLEEYIAADEIVKADAGWQAAMARRGITDLDLVCPCPLSAGAATKPDEQGRRMVRVLSFVRHRETDHPWAHPVDGLVAYVDLTQRRVIELIDDVLLPVPSEEHNHDDPEYVGPLRTTLKPIEITQPEGPSFTVDDDVVSWEGWRFRIGFDAREGLTLHQLSLHGRDVVYRASIAEMVVPYADPSPARWWQNYFDAGEYSLGAQVNALQLGCDCLGEIHYFDAVIADDLGEPQTRPNAICMHEEDFGVLWKHTDLFTGSSETRRQRRLVISSFVTVGNYDYGFYWYLYLDGAIELECKATGVMFTSAYVAGSPWADEVAPGLGGPYHQHLWCARLDMTVDGVVNSVNEVQLQRLPIGPDNPYGNAFTKRVTPVERESQGARMAEPASARAWHVVNPTKHNRVGGPVGYALYPQGQPVLAADPAASISQRAAFATHHLWVTQYDPAERYPSGDLPNQHVGGAGLPAWTAQDRDLQGADIVLWHTFGLTHFLRTEDWPVMPVDRAGFTLKPVGFFDRNPTLDVPASTASHCASPAAEGDSSCCS
ncbi:primary-amine oxidase [Catellatospora sichuanensis]|uniref:primary-amine oxidase n=1 Tax=Catellatospora sichuanensis TaxID=1969805 RepID=UPI00118410C0|nr:primary-amine oxidase [Catellatospora sichuanensis]